MKNFKTENIDGGIPGNQIPMMAGKNKNRPASAELVSRLEFISRILGELRQMSVDVDDGTLPYLIEMAYLHAEEELARIALREN